MHEKEVFVDVYKRQVLRRPPVGGVAVLVVLGSIVVKGVRNLVRDDVADAAEVLLTRGVHVIQRSLQDARRKYDFIAGGYIAGVDLSLIHI